MKRVGQVRTQEPILNDDEKHRVAEDVETHDINVLENPEVATTEAEPGESGPAVGIYSEVEQSDENYMTPVGVADQLEKQNQG